MFFFVLLFLGGALIILLSYLTQTTYLFDNRDEFPPFSGLGLDSNCHPYPEYFNQEKFDSILDSKEEEIDETLFFRSFAVGLMVFGLSGAISWAFQLNPVLVVMIAALAGLIGFFIAFWFIKKSKDY